MSDPGGPPSWDVAREEAPERPELPASLVEPPTLDRPRWLIAAFAFVLASAAVWVVATVLAALRLEEITGTLLDALPTELAEDYGAADRELAVQVLLGAAGALGFVLTLAEVLSARACVVRRSSSARITFLVVALLSLPVTLITPALRDGGTVDTALSGAIAVLLLGAAVLLCLPATSRWLRQSEEKGPTPLAELRDKAKESR